LITPKPVPDAEKRTPSLSALRYSRLRENTTMMMILRCAACRPGRPGQNWPPVEMKHALYSLIIFLFSVAILGCSSTPPIKKEVESAAYTETGKATFYAEEHKSEKTASGELYNPDLKTAAHRTIPLGSKIKVTNVDNGKSVVVTVNDRGPFAKDRIVDLSKSAFSSIGSLSSGVISVQIQVIE
jgi:rare lipoprotein A